MADVSNSSSADPNRKTDIERKCCNVPGCSAESRDGDGDNQVILFEIPKRVRCTPEIRSQWLKLLKLNCSRFPPNFQICEKHFEKTDILKPEENWVTLLPKAIPVHFLPDENTPMEEYAFEQEDDEDSDDYPQSRDSIEKDNTELTSKIVTIEEQQSEAEMFHDAMEKFDEKDNVEGKGKEESVLDVNVKKEEQQEENNEEEEKVYHDLKPHQSIIEEMLPSEGQAPEYSSKIAKLKKEVVSKEKIPEEKGQNLKVIKRAASARSNPDPVQQDRNTEESSVKRPRRNVVHKLIKPRNIQDTIPLKVPSTPAKKVVSIIRSENKVDKKALGKIQQTALKTAATVVKAAAATAKPVKESPKIEKEKVPRVVIKAIQKTVPKESENDSNGGITSRSRRNVVHKLIKPRVELTPIVQAKVNKISSPVIKSVAITKKVEIYSSTVKKEENTPKKEVTIPKSPKIVMISSKLIQSSPKFVKTPNPQVLKLSPRNVVVTNKPSAIVVTPKVSVKRLPAKIHPVENEDSSRPRRNVPHKFIKTFKSEADKEKKASVTVTATPAPPPPRQKLDPIESMHTELLKEFLSDSNSVQLETVKKKATSIAKIIGFKGFKASDDWTKKFIAGNLGTCNGTNTN